MFIKTVSTTSGINPVKFDETSGVFYWILNTGSTTVYASTEETFSAGDDGVVSLGPKESRRLETRNDTIYILGEGQVEIHNQSDGICSFKEAPTSSGGGGTIDAYTKTESDAKYAQKSDIPTTLPANGGNADTLSNVPLSVNGAKGIPAISSNYGGIELGRYIDFHTGEGTDYDFRLYCDIINNIIKFINSDTSLATLAANIIGDASTVGGKTADELIKGYTIRSNRTVLSVNDDLNEYMTTGLFVSNTVTLSNSISNTPFTTSGYYLDVYVWNDSNNIQQRAVTWAGREAIRWFNGTAWTEWREFAAFSDLISYIKKAETINIADTYTQDRVINDSNGVPIYAEYSRKTSSGTADKKIRLFGSNSSEFSDFQPHYDGAGNVIWYFSGTGVNVSAKINSNNILTEATSALQEIGTTPTLSNGTKTTIAVSFNPKVVLLMNSGHVIDGGYAITMGTKQFSITPSAVATMGTTAPQYIAFG